MAVTTTLESVSVTTSLSGSGVTTSVDNSTVEVTLEGGTVVVTEMQGPPGSAANVTSSNIRAAMVPAGDLSVRYDAVQPEVDCLWVGPDGQVVLITGSI